MTMEVFVFDVSRGLCVLVRTPACYGVMIDCGRSPDFSPACWVATKYSSNLKTWNQKSLTRLLVTHPHDDHVEDIANIKKHLPPAILQRHKDYDWKAVLNPADHDPSLNAKEYFEWQKTYSRSLPKEELPDFQCDFETFSLRPSESAALNPNSQQLLNNSSIISVFTWRVQSGAWKLVVCGDNETAGLQKLLERRDFRAAVSGADFLVTPHHGHNSGYCPDFMAAIGTPLCNITSERAGDESVASAYSNQASGVKFKGQDRKHLTTRTDGHICLTLNDDLTYRFQ